MADSNFSSRDRSQEQGCSVILEGHSVFVEREEQLLQAISARAPLAEVLHKICDALDSEIGNMMSVIALLNDDAPAWRRFQEREPFRLAQFCSANVVGGNDESLGSLEMYCSVPRGRFSTKFN